MNVARGFGDGGTIRKEYLANESIPSDDKLGDLLTGYKIKRAMKAQMI